MLTSSSVLSLSLLTAHDQYSPKKAIQDKVNDGTSPWSLLSLRYYGYPILCKMQSPNQLLAKKTWKKSTWKNSAENTIPSKKCKRWSQIAPICGGSAQCCTNDGFLGGSALLWKSIALEIFPLWWQRQMDPSGFDHGLTGDSTWRILYAIHGEGCMFSRFHDVLQGQNTTMQMVHRGEIERRG